VVLADGTLVAVRKGPERSGVAVTLALRPEKLTVTDAGDSAAEGNRVAGRVRRRVYHGDSVTYEIDGGEGMRLRVRHANHAGAQVHDEGAKVVVTWPTDAAQVLES
jgi:ABC-type Fe3+/spermidine/putrescine transport system ATPase subunit